MVSPLWQAVSDGKLDAVLAVLNDPVDVDEKDHTGATPLVEAVKNGNIEVVRALLNKGADPNATTTQGRVETYTQDPAIHELLRFYQMSVHPDAGHETAYVHDDAVKGYYAPPPPPPGAYAYYPPMNGVMPPMGDAGVYYPPHPNGDPNAFGHLPPPDIAKMIPCRYYPACRYGVHCVFAHPGAPYNPPPPPGQYPPFDPSMGSPYGYYPPPPAFQQPNVNVPSPMSPMSPPPGPPPMHARSPSEGVPPQVAFANGGPPPPMGPYGPMSPSAYPHPGPVPVPMPLPPMHHQPPPPSGPVPQSPNSMYNPPVPFPGHDGQYYPPPPMGYPDVDGKPPGSNGQPDGFVPQPAFRDGNGPRRGGAPRRNSFVKAHKPPCMFFPSGRCKNGDDCRFPHVLSENPGPNHAQHYFTPRAGAPRPPRGPNHANGVAAISQKMGSMNVRDDASRPQNGATEGSSRSQSTDPTNRPKFPQGPHKHHNGMNGKRVPGAPPIRPQRVPSADDFPVLPGSVTPPKRVNGVNGPTAAQILSAPAPAKKENSVTPTVSTSGSVRARSPEPVQAKEETQAEVTKPTSIPEQAQEVAPAPIQAPTPVTQKFPLSFAAAAKTATAVSTPETPKEVSVSA